MSANKDCCCCCWVDDLPAFTDKGKASFLESEGVAILKKVAQESDDNELIDLVFEILSSIIVDGKYVFFLLQLSLGRKNRPEWAAKC